MVLEAIKAILRESKVCRNSFHVVPLAKKLKPLIENVKVTLPSSVKGEYQNRPLKLEKSSPESKLRLQYLKEFSVQPNASEKSKNFDTFFEDFQTFLDGRSALLVDKILEDTYKIIQDSERNEEEDFVHKARIEGVVLRTSPSYVSLITLDESEELLVKVNREFVGFGIKVRTGDVISVVNPKFTRNKGSDLDPELKCIYKVYPHEVNDFLDKLKAKDDACTLLEGFLRSVAVWEYVLNVSVKEEEEEQSEMCKKILEVCQKVSDISYNSPMAGTIRNIWTSFKGSKFFIDVLPKLVNDETWPQENEQLVKNFLVNLLKHLPECGARAIEIVKKLNIVSTTGTEFMETLLSILALNVSGVKDNPSHLKWNQQSIIPVSSELLTTDTQWKDLPHVKVKTDDKNKSLAEYSYKSEEEYIMTYYTLMREECFHKLKFGIGHFLATGKFDPKDIMMYRVCLLKALPNIKQSIQEGLALVFELSKKEKTDESNDPDNSSWLMCGNLLCLSFDGTFQCPVWGIISGDSEERNQVQVSLCSERNKLSEAEVITKLQQLQDKDCPAYMAESNTYYRAYGPSLEVLQQKEIVPFKEQLVQVQKCTDPPEYLKNLKKPPDWSIIFTDPGCIELHDGDDYSYELLMKEFTKLKENKDQSKPKLDEKQLDAVEQALRNKVTLIQGPPGTGKSYVGEALLQLLLSMEVPENNGPILVVTYKNHALDNFLQTCAEKIPDFRDKLVRVGRGSDDASEDLKQCRIYEKLKNSSWDKYWQSSKRLKLQLEVMKPDIEKCVKSLRCSNKFTVPVFIKEADNKHLLHLCTKHNYSERMQQILKDKNFRVKHFKELCQIIEEPLKEWLPNQKKFEMFAGKVTEKGLQSCVDDENYGIQYIKQESTKKQKEEEGKDEACNTRQSLPSEERKERKADDNDELSEEEEGADNETHLPEETPLIVLPEIPDEKLGNVKAILNAGNIQELKDGEKMQMVYALQRQRYKTVTNEFSQLTQDFNQKQQRKKEADDQRQIKILQEHSVIGMTVSGAAIRASWLESIKPSVIIVEEAAEILESQLVAVIPSSVQHLVMIGDHQQLRPQVHYDLLCRKCDFHISMFERLIKGGLDYAQLNQQGRMRDDLAQLVRELGIYKEYKTRDEVVEKNKVHDCLPKSMYFYDHKRVEKKQSGSHSMYNEHEADEIVKMAKYLVCDNNVKPSDITVLCSYRGQVKYLEKKLEKQDAYRLTDLTVTTIDSFQGKENDIILLSLVRSQIGANAKIGYLSSINRICVAVSRARIGLYLFGNSYLLKKKSSRGWGKIIDHMSEKGLVGSKSTIEFLTGRAVAADEPSPGCGDTQPRKHFYGQSPISMSVTVNIDRPNVVSIGDQTSVKYYHDGMSDNHQVHGWPQQQSTPSRPPQDDQHSPAERQPVEEMSKLITSSATSSGNQHNSPSAEGLDDQHSQERQPVEETSKRNTSSVNAGGNQHNSPSSEDREAQEMSWIAPQPSDVEADGRPNLPTAEDREGQEMSWTGAPQPSAVEADGRPLQETGDIEKRRPVQDTHLAKGQEEEGKEEGDKVQSVEETSDKKGELVVGTQSDVPLLSGDDKVSSEDASAGSPQQDSNLPSCESPLGQKRGQKLFDEKDACILNKSLKEAPASADLIQKLQNRQKSNPECLGDINLDNPELTIGEIREKVSSDVQEILDQYVEGHGCNCDECGSLR